MVTMLNKIVKNKKYKRIALAIILLTAVLSMVIIGYSNASNTQYENYNYSRGDTIWKTSSSHSSAAGIAIKDNKTYIAGNGGGIEVRHLSNGSLIYQNNTYDSKVFGPVINKYTMAYGHENFVVRDIDGSLVWTESSQQYYRSSPVIKNGYIYYTRLNGDVRKATVRNNGTDWVRKNLITVDSWRDMEAAVSVNEKYVFAPMGENLFVLNKSNGDVVYNKSFDHVLIGGGVSVDGKYYIGTENGNVTSIDLDTGLTEQTSITTDQYDREITELTYDSGVIYGGAYDGNTFAMNLNEKLLWKNMNTNTSDNMDTVNTMPVVTDNYVYSIDDSGSQAVVYDKKDGNLVYTYSTPDNYHEANPAIANGYYIFHDEYTNQIIAKATGDVTESAVGASRRNVDYGFDSSVEPQDLGEPNVFGYVFNETHALENVKVTAKQNRDTVDTTTTNSTGGYQLQVPNGTAKLIFSADKYQNRSIEIDVSGKTIVRNITLNKNRISVRYGGCLEPNEETPYNLYFHGPNGVENDRPKSIVVNNNTVLSVSLLDGIINTTNKGISNVTFTYKYNDITYSITKEIRVFNNSIENLHNRQGTCKFIAFTGDEVGGQNSNVQWIILGIFFGVVTSYGFRNKWVGLVAIQLLITIGWFMNFLNSGIMLGSLFYALFISLATISAFKQRVNVNLPR